MSLRHKLKAYHFEIKHIIILFALLAIFQIILSYINSTSTSNLLNKTMDIYRKDSAERVADLMTTSMELFLEHNLINAQKTELNKRETVRAFNIILNQQILQQNMDEICILISEDDRIYAIDEGAALYSFFFENKLPPEETIHDHTEAVNLYSELKQVIIEREEIQSIFDESHTFHVFVPFVPGGELVGAVYMKIAPNFANIEESISSAYNETGAIFSALILLGLMAIFYVSSYTVRERDQALQQLFSQKHLQMKQQIETQKEALFTQRIYHAHHKAEKIMGFIKTDLKSLSHRDDNPMFEKISKYSNFVSRVIYDMKSYDPPVDVIRNPMFQTVINDVIQFLVENVFERVYKKSKSSIFTLDLDPDFPILHINEYVIWEILEPLIQNSIDHNRGRKIKINISTRYKRIEDSGAQQGLSVKDM